MENWRPLHGLLALLFTFLAALSLIVVAGAVITAAGVKDLDKSSTFTIVSSVITAAVFVAAAFFAAHRAGPFTLSDFGFKRFKPSAFSWLLLAFVVFAVFAAVYSTLFHPSDDEDLLRDLGAFDSTWLAVATGLLLIVAAPFSEELFFRGFLFRSIANGTGVWRAALLSGALFGLFHVELDKIVPIGFLGFVLAMLYSKTGSLWPSIILHAIYNGIVFAVLI